MSNSPKKPSLRPETIAAIAEILEAHGIHDGDADVSGCRRQASAATPKVIATRLNFSLRDFGRVAAILSTCKAALPPECAVGEADVRGSLEVAERLLGQAVADLERLQD